MQETKILLHEYVLPSIHAGGLRYHGDSPIVSQLYADKLIDTVMKDSS